MAVPVLLATDFIGPALAHFEPSAARPNEPVQLILSVPAESECAFLLAVFAPGAGTSVQVLGLMRLEKNNGIGSLPHHLPSWPATPAHHRIKPANTEHHSSRPAVTLRA